MMKPTARDRARRLSERLRQRTGIRSAAGAALGTTWSRGHAPVDTERKIVYLMRGLPSCGKSTTAKRLAGNAGVICETDHYFHSQVGGDTNRFDYDVDQMWRACLWNYRRFTQALSAGLSPIIVDRGNARSLDTQIYARRAIQAGYAVELKEPDSPQWEELRVLLKYKDVTWPILKEWAERLAKMNRKTHRVPAKEILRRMKHWRNDVTVESILAYRPRAGLGLQRALVDRTPDGARD